MFVKEKIANFKKARAQLVYDAWTEYLNKTLNDRIWYSSSQILENALRERGVDLPKKLYYEYKFPDNMLNFEVEQSTLFTRCFPAIYENYLGQFERDEPKKALLLYQKNNAKNDLSAFFGFCISLALSDIKNLKSVFEQSHAKCMQEVYQLAEKIRELNPELQSIKDWRNLDFVNGALYGFAPDEIEFFIRLQNCKQKDYTDYETYNGYDEYDELEQTLINAQEITDFLGVEITYFPALKTSEAILKAIDNYKQKQGALAINANFEQMINKSPLNKQYF